jgi:hypothetical protein
VVVTPKGERQISVEGNGYNPRFTPDGKKLCYMIVKQAPNQFAWHRNPGELRVADLRSGRSEPLVPGLPVLEYDISADGRQVVMSTTDREGKPRLWVVPFDRSSPPVQIPNVEGMSPRIWAGRRNFLSPPGWEVRVCLPRSPERHRTSESTRRTGIAWEFRFARWPLDCGLGPA